MSWKKITKGVLRSYEEKYMEVKDDIEENVRQHELFVAIDEWINFSDIHESDFEGESSDFNMVNPDLGDLNLVSKNI